jgi:hypothetical protein
MVDASISSGDDGKGRGMENASACKGGEGHGGGMENACSANGGTGAGNGGGKVKDRNVGGVGNCGKVNVGVVTGM